MVGGELVGDPERLVTGLAGVREAAPGDISFIAGPKYAPAIKTTRASVLIVASDLDATFAGTLIRVADPSEAFATLAGQVAPPPVVFKVGVHPTAVVASTATFGRDVSVQSHAVI